MRWKVFDRHGGLCAVGPTEGQAWMALFSGHCPGDGWELLRLVGRLKRSGFRAAETKEGGWKATG